MNDNIERNMEDVALPQPPPKPVAYDANGQPLYAAPPQPTQPTSSPSATITPQPQVVHMTRSYDPIEEPISEEVRQKHEESMRHFPGLNLSEHEYIISAVRRHPIGMVGPLVATGFSVAIVMAFIMNYLYIAEVFGFPEENFGIVLLIGVLVCILFLIGGYLAVWVYLNNRFFLTNESVIQEIQTSLFTRKEQTVSLANIEDASFDQKGPLQTLLNYGKIRLSTEGEETTYRFDFVANPKREIAILNNAVEAFKNGRPVDPSIATDPDDN